MAGTESLKRLGGGRWETRDGRFTIEPESGTWVVVDTEQQNELGLPLVRGPFPSLTAARAAIDAAREAEPAESPLAERLAAAPPPSREEASPSRSRRARPGPERASERLPERPPERAPEPPPEPAWLRRLEDEDRRRVREIVRRLEKAGVDDPLSVARAEVADDQPALARLAIERRLREAAQAPDARQAVQAAVEAILAGRDAALGARWRLVDGEGREIRQLDVDLD